MQPTAPQAGLSALSSTGEQEDRGEQARPPQTQIRRPAAVRMATKKRKAVESDEESGGEVENRRKTKVYTYLTCDCSPLLICDVLQRAKRDRT